MDCSMPGFPVLHNLPELTQTHVHWVGDAIQPSHPLSSPSPALNLSRHQGLFEWVDSSHQAAKALRLQLQHQSSNECSRISSILDNWLVWFPWSPRDSQESSSTSQFKSISSLVLSLSDPALTSMTTGKTTALTRWTFVGKVMSLLFEYAVKFGHNFLSKE